MMNRENLSKSLVAASPQKGQCGFPQRCQGLNPGQGLNPQFLDELIGKTLKRDLDEEDYFFPTDLSKQSIEPRAYQFKMPWGVPVRYHDFAEYAERSSRNCSNSTFPTWTLTSTRRTTWMAPTTRR